MKEGKVFSEVSQCFYFDSSRLFATFLTLNFFIRAMNCLQSKKQKTGNTSEEPEEQHPNYRHTNGHSSTSLMQNGHHNGLTNGHSNGLTNGHSNGLTNGHSNGYAPMQKVKVAVPDMCIFCFDVLHNELLSVGEPRRPNFTNQA